MVEIAGRTEPLRIEGMMPADFSGAVSRRPSRPVVDFELREDASLGILTVSTFGDPPGGSYPALLKDAFSRIREAGVRRVVLDLRGNGGGDDNYGALLVSYFSPEPFGYFDHIEVTESYSGEGGIVDRDGMRLVTEHPGTQVQAPRARSRPHRTSRTVKRGPAISQEPHEVPRE